MNETHTPPTEVAVVLGRVPELARREVELTLGRAGHRIAELTVASGVALVKADPKPEKSWFLTLGGATKFGSVIAVCPATLAAVTEALSLVVREGSTVGISVVHVALDPNDIGRDLKEKAGVRRYVVARKSTTLSAAQSKGVELEYLVLGAGQMVRIIAIEAAQDIDAFTERDRGLPVVDPVRGMLPTKLARAMVNLGLGLVPTMSHPVLLDPFCGTGRILLEATLLDAQILGADIDPVAVRATRQNLVWATERFHPDDATFDLDQILLSSIDKLAPLLSAQSVDVIVTEPHLGPPQRHIPRPADIERLFSTLTPSYEALFRTANHLLTPSGALVVVFPAIGTQSLLEQLVDRVGEMGYHASDVIRVERPDSVVSRVITTLVRK